MKITFTNPYLSLVNEYLIDSPLPANISYFYNFGSLLAANLAILIITGVSLAMHYNSTLSGAFSSVEHISRDVHFGWALRFIHMNTVSFFFLCAYLHIARGLFFSSYKSPRTTLWLVGVLIFFLMMATAFIGYVLPWSSMSFWGATVICNLFSAFPWFGPDLVSFIWGGGSVDGPTLNRFFALHYLLPFLLSALILLHLLALHLPGSTNPEGLPSHTDRIRFHPYFTTKDLVGLFWLLLFLSYFVFFDPHALGHPDASVPANPLVTPASIVPEWYFLPFYAILRAIPNKLLGVLAMFSSIAILIPLSLFSTLNLLSLRYRPLLQFFFWIFSFNFLFLILLGAKPICEPFTTLGQISTFIYFSYFFLLLLLGWLPYLGDLVDFPFCQSTLSYTSSMSSKASLLVIPSFPMFSPMEQFLIFPVFGSLSNLAFFLLLSLLLSLFLSLPSSSIFPNNWSLFSESLFHTVLHMIESFVSPKASIYLPLFYSLAHLILFSNFLGLLPYSSTPTVEIVLTLSLSFTFIIGFAILGFLTHRLYLLSLFLPAGTPLLLVPLMVLLEINAYFSRTLSLGLRLAINLITGHTLCKVVAGFLWLGHLSNSNLFLLGFGVFLLTLFLCLEFLVAYLQCYIFLFISLLTLKDVSLTS